MSTDGNGQGDAGFQTAFTDAVNAPQPAAVPQPQPPAEPVQPLPAPPPEPAPAPVAPPAPEPIAPPAPFQAPGTQQIEPPQPPEPQLQQQQLPFQSEVATMAAQAGLDVTGKTDTQIFQEMAQGYQKMQPYANWAQQLLPHYDQITELLQTQQQPTPQPRESAEPEWTAQQYFQDQWKAPQWDQQFDVAINNNYVRRNGETGIWEATPGFEAMTMAILPKMNEVLTHSQQQWQDITKGNPFERFYDVLREPMQRAWKTDMEQLIDQRLSDDRSAANADQFETDNAHWLYGQDPNSGQKVMTDKGKQFYEAITYFQERGVTDPQALIDCATRVAREAAPTQQQQVPAPVQQPNQLAPPATPQQAPPEQPQQTFLQNALDRARHQPNSGGFTQQSPGDPVNVGENELNNMFISALSASNT